jgi:hypothetical protein
MKRKSMQLEPPAPRHTCTVLVRLSEQEASRLADLAAHRGEKRAVVARKLIAGALGSLEPG